MSALEPEFAVALFHVGGLALAIDAARLISIEEHNDEALDPLAGLHIERSTGGADRCGRFAYHGRETCLRLGPRIDIVTVGREDVFALPPLLEDLEFLGVLGILRRGDVWFSLLDASGLCASGGAR